MLSIRGNGQFIIQKLPEEIQFSSVKSILFTDVNNDGIVDVILGGNEFNFQPQLGRLDASTGDVLLNDGKGNFKRLEPEQSGILLHGAVRDIVEIKGNRAVQYCFFKTMMHQYYSNQGLKEKEKNEEEK